MRQPEDGRSGPGSPDSSWRRDSSPALFLSLMFLGYAVYAADRTVLSSMLKPLSLSLGLTDFQKGLLTAAQYLGVLSLVFVSGYLSDRYGTRRIILLGVGVFTAATWAIGLSQSFSEAFLLRLVSGFGEGLFWPAAMSAVANYFGTRKGLALGVFYAGFDVGGASGNSIGSVSFALTTDWRTAFFVAPLLGIPVILGVLASRRSFPSGRGTGPGLSLGVDAVSLLRQPRILKIMIFALLATWASVWQVAYIPYYYSTVLKVDVPTAGLIGASVLIAGMFGKVALGKMSDSWNRTKMLASISLVVVALYAVFFSTSSFTLGIGCALAMGFFSSAIFPIMQTLAVDYSGGRAGTALGLTTTFQSVAAVFATTLTAALFTLGTGNAVALDALVPAALMVPLAFMLRESRVQK